MKILLIRPNSRLMSTYMPIGMGYVADAVRRQGHDVRLLDARLERLSPRETAVRVKESGPDIVGFSALHLEKEDVRITAEVLRGEFGIIPMVLGGPLASTSGYEMVKEKTVDVAVLGEAEISFCQYLDASEKGGGLDSVPGIIYLCDGEVKTNAVGPFLSDLDAVMPAWDLINPERYFGRFSRSRMGILKGSDRGASIFTSRGCPFGCIYCHNMFGRKFRARSVGSVLDEIVMLRREYGIRELEIVDDCFNLDLERAKAIMKGIIGLDGRLSLSFPNGLRADRMDEELIDLLRDAGTYRVNYAVETASQRLQKLIRKNLDLERTREVIAYTADRGIMTFGFFMLGFPTETEFEMRMTVDYALRSKFHAAYFFYVNPFPGTPLAEEFLLPASTVSDVDAMDYYDLRINLSEVSDDTLSGICRSAYRRFYFSPRRMWRIFRVAPKNLRTLWGVIIIGLLSLRDKSNW